ncbi:MAG: MFS transporter [Deltaproteobacteria bacterium]|nr:MFS transporter [Deltaproteobacteria bacterium]
MSRVDRDRSILYAAGFLRAVNTACVGILLGLHLARIGLTPGTAGQILTSGLLGAASVAGIATFFADRIGPRTFLFATSALGAIGTVAFVLTSSPFALGAAAFVAGLNAVGKDRSAALIIEQSTLPATVSDEHRTRAIAVHTMLEDLGHALGSLLAGVPSLLSASAAPDLHLALGLTSLGPLAAIALYATVGSAFAAPRTARVAVSPESRRILTRISSLFLLDALGGGFLASSLLTWFFFERFGAREMEIGVLFALARGANALSHLGAAWLARRIGLVNTMVFTHIPSSLLLVTVAFAPSFPVAAVLFLLREGLVEMDVPTRQSYVLAVVRAEERTFATGVTQLVRLLGWAVAPAFAGALIEGTELFAPLVAAAAMKIAYDVMLYFSFRRLRPPEEISDPRDAGDE